MKMCTSAMNPESPGSPNDARPAMTKNTAQIGICLAMPE